ncbi:MAG: aminomethyl-transferring glycine dehydrogenase [Bacteroidota bacterium]
MNLFSMQSEEFIGRHIGPNAYDTQHMLDAIGVDSMDELVGRTVPAGIRMDHRLRLPEALSEAEYLAMLKEISLKNKVYKTYIGRGYYDTHTPSVILRNVFENPGWYTQYTPYQAEISQGRLESLLNFQTMVSDLTGLQLANASLLDEGTAAAEAMAMFFHTLNKDDKNPDRPKFFVDHDVFPQTRDVVITRATPLGIEVVTGDYRIADLDTTYFGALLQYPNDKGSVEDYRGFIATMHEAGGYVAMATDLLALTLLTSPGELGADVALGSAQRFGVPLGYGGPHAAFFATKDDFKRQIPGRIIGISVDAHGNRALRMALQTREQHIKREKATSNICTAQALLANMAAMYAVFHGPSGLKNIAKRVAALAQALGNTLADAGMQVHSESYFDTVAVTVADATAVRKAAENRSMNFCYHANNIVSISLDETTTPSDVLDIVSVLTNTDLPVSLDIDEATALTHIPTSLTRTSDYLTHQVFNSHHSETQMMRYIKMLENKDLSLNTSMISLGSCTMKLNAASEMIPLSWVHWSKMHPFAPADQCEGYAQIVRELSAYLCEITAFDACSLQPNSGAQGEYAGLLAIRDYHHSRNEGHRDVILIPISAHGTNPASAVMVGYKVVVVKALENGYIDVTDLKAKATQHAANLAGIMITYPSTYGVYEETVKDITDIVHAHGGQVYMDGANMNAQVGLTAPGLIGADVCHLNLHKTFAIPHGGGGPGMGPICVRQHLAPFLPGHVSLSPTLSQGEGGVNAGAHAVSAAPYGSASILLISYGYIRMLGPVGVRKATEYAILNANYMRARLQNDFDILYTGSGGTCAHEFIVDLRPFKKTAEIEAEDVAKRLIDYGFHAPTMSFPVPGTIMIEPTESEDKAELDRFCDALLGIREEIRAVEEARADRNDNVLKNAPHTQHVITADEWNHKYSRQQAAFPLHWVRSNKFWPSVARVNNTYGDRNLICTCEPTEAYAEA